MRVFHWPDGPRPPAEERLLAVGAFDGLHLGHRQVVEQLIADARRRGWLACLVTFEPLPAQVFSAEPPHNLRLTTGPERLDLFAHFGLDEVCVLDFARPELRSLTAEAFLREIAAGWLGAAGLLGSASHTMGSDQQPWPVLARLARAAGLEVFQVEPVSLSSTPISSTRIRQLVWQGRVAEAAELIGRDYTGSGLVVPGTGTGRTLGFPTLNLELAPDKLLPAGGVYAGWAWGEALGPGPLTLPFAGRAWPAAINIGTCPTRTAAGTSETLPAAPDRTVEAFLLDWRGDAVGQPVLLGFTRRLRAERRFPDLEALRRQIQRDVRRTDTITRRRYAPGA